LVLLHELIDARSYERVVGFCIVHIAKHVPLGGQLLVQVHGAAHAGPGDAEVAMMGRADYKDVDSGLLLARWRRRKLVEGMLLRMYGAVGVAVHVVMIFTIGHALLTAGALFPNGRRQRRGSARRSPCASIHTWRLCGGGTCHSSGQTDWTSFATMLAPFFKFIFFNGLV
jgi:hypothetical protein